MGRVCANIDVKGRHCWTLFDSVAENTYVTRPIGEMLGTRGLPKSWKTRFCGRVHRVSEKCDLVARVRGKLVEVEAYVLESIGRDRRAHRDWDVLFGALAMQKWNLELDLKNERVDVSGYAQEFQEF